MLITMLIITAATFFLMHSIPGDPLSYMARNLPEQTRENYYATYGLDKPVYEQFAIFMKNLVTEGKFWRIASVSWAFHHRYDPAKFSGVRRTRRACPGVWPDHRCDPWNYRKALKKNKWPDYIVMFIAIVGITVPVFILASLFQYVFAVKLHVLPTQGWGQPSNIIMPAVVMSFGTIATYARYVKSTCWTSWDRTTF